MAILSSGKQSVEVNTTGKWDNGVWFFCQNGYQSTGVNISVEQFDMIKKLVQHPEVVEFYEAKRNEGA